MADQLKEDFSSRGKKRRYVSPALLVFGNVKALTKNFGGSCQDDGNNCDRGTGSMGPMN